jgi:hypothetical protein
MGKKEKEKRWRYGGRREAACTVLYNISLALPLQHLSPTSTPSNLHSPTPNHHTNPKPEANPTKEKRRKIPTHVNGTLNTSKSIFCFKKLCKFPLSSPLYHSVGNSPSGSPVPGTMKPSSRLDSGVGRGEAVKAITSLPMAFATRATVARLVSQWRWNVSVIGSSC